jgi:gamma-glutamylcyclotransferase (GGCT)/AIG2-like uncharacterized protein YtfP
MAKWNELFGLVRAHLEAGRTVQGYRRGTGKLSTARRAAQFPLISPLPLALLLSHPEERLIVYGTLVPGGQYHHLLADLAAAWERCTIRGSLGSYRGYPSFKWNPAGQPHPAWLVTSPQLPGKFRQLDYFEGRAYTRRLIPAETGRGLVIAYIYEGKVVA